MRKVKKLRKDALATTKQAHEAAEETQQWSQELLRRFDPSQSQVGNGYPEMVPPSTRDGEGDQPPGALLRAKNKDKTDRTGEPIPLGGPSPSTRSPVTCAELLPAVLDAVAVQLPLDLLVDAVTKADGRCGHHLPGLTMKTVGEWFTVSSLDTLSVREWQAEIGTDVWRFCRPPDPSEADSMWPGSPRWIVAAGTDECMFGCLLMGEVVLVRCCAYAL